jgi:hypothetical protein
MVITSKKFAQSLVIGARKCALALHLFLGTLQPSSWLMACRSLEAMDTATTQLRVASAHSTALTCMSRVQIMSARTRALGARRSVWLLVQSSWINGKMFAQERNLAAVALWYAAQPMNKATLRQEITSAQMANGIRRLAWSG